MDFRGFPIIQMVVTVITKVFDSSLIAWLLTRVLPDQYNTIAFRDDDKWPSNHAPYSLRIRIGGDDGQEFSAGAVQLGKATSPGREVAITLAPIKPDDVSRDRDVTELKWMFGKPKKVVSIKEMNAAIAARGADASK